MTQTLTAKHEVRTILLVEDEAPVRRLLCDSLASKYEVLESRDGVEAVSVFEKNLFRILAVVTDLEMPRLKGDVLTEWIHSIRPDLPVIIISGKERADDSIRELLKSTAVRFLGKPFDLYQLEDLLDQAVA
jgi:two-component system cell cycle sensor histidine kinase/response regulator CckA